MVRLLKNIIRKFALKPYKAILKYFAYKKIEKLNKKDDSFLKLQVDRFFEHLKLDNSLIHTKNIIPEIEKVMDFNGKDINILLIGPCNHYEVDAFEILNNKKSGGGDIKIYAIDLVSTDKRITVMDMHNLEYEDNFFDLIYSSGVIHCSNNPKQLGKELFRVIKNKGIVAIGVTIGLDPMDKHYVTDYKDVSGIIDIFPKPKPTVLYTNIEQPNSLKNPHSNEYLKCILKFEGEKNGNA